MTDASTTEAISANQIVGNSYLEIAKIQAQTAITIAESNVASAIAQHMQSAIEETITSTRESSDAMMLKFREMDAPKELIEKYRSSMESLIIESVKTLQEKAITKIQNA